MNRTRFEKINIYRGFTLIELLVVIAIIGLLATILEGPIQNARNKAKDARKIADLRNIKNALTIYAHDNDTFPDRLDDLYPNYLDSNLPNFAANYTPQIDKYMYVTYEDQSTVNAITGFVNYGYHLLVKLRVTGNAALDGDADCMGIGPSTTNCVPPPPIGGLGLASAVVTVTNFANASDPGAPPQGSDNTIPWDDFASPTSDDSVNNVPVACTAAVTTCNYDIKGQI